MLWLVPHADARDGVPGAGERAAIKAGRAAIAIGLDLGHTLRIVDLGEAKDLNDAWRAGVAVVAMIDDLGDVGGAGDDTPPTDRSNGHGLKGGALVTEKLEEEQARAEIDAFAERDRESSVAAKPHAAAARFQRCPELVDAILASAQAPWIELRLNVDGMVIVKVRLGAYLVLIGSEGQASRPVAAARQRVRAQRRRVRVLHRRARR